MWEFYAGSEKYHILKLISQSYIETSEVHVYLKFNAVSSIYKDGYEYFKHLTKKLIPKWHLPFVVPSSSNIVEMLSMYACLQSTFLSFPHETIHSILNKCNIM